MKKLIRKKFIKKLAKILTACGDFEIDLEEIGKFSRNKYFFLTNRIKCKDLSKLKEDIELLLPNSMEDILPFSQVSDVWIHFKISDNFPLFHLQFVIEYVNSKFDDTINEPDIIFTTNNISDLDDNYANITIFLS